MERTKPKPPPFTQRLLAVWQTLLALFLGLLTLGTALGRYQLQAPQAPLALFWATVCSGSLLTALHTPPWFAGRSSAYRKALYFGTLAFFVLWLITINQVRAAWEQTPRGAAEARERAAAEEAERKRAAELQEIEELSRQIQESTKDLERKAGQLESCFTTFGHRLPVLETTVRDSLHNPHSFEHVLTEAIPADPDGYNVVMTFRAENGFGALRTLAVRATVTPGSCTLGKVDEPEQA